MEMAEERDLLSCIQLIFLERTKRIMKLVKSQDRDLLNKRYLIPSIIAIGLIPLITHEQQYNTHLDNAEWFAAGNPTAVDFFLVWKQWAVVALAIICLIILAVRVNYYYEELPWLKKPFIPALIYGAMVIISAICAKQKLFAFAGGYDMFQSALAILSYLVIMYYTFSCIKSVDHAIYLVRYSSYFMFIEMVFAFFQSIHLDLLSTPVGKVIITNPARWSQLQTLTLADSIYGTIYNPDYLSMYIPTLLPLIGALFLLDKEKKQKIFDGILFVLSFYILLRSPSSGKLAIIGMVVIGALILLFRNKKHFIIGVVLVCAVVVAGLLAVKFIPSLNQKAVSLWYGDPAYAREDKDCPVKQITTGNKDKGVTFEMKDGTKFSFKWEMKDGAVANLKAYDKDGNELFLHDLYQGQQKYVVWMPEGSADDVDLSVDTTKGSVMVKADIDNGEAEYYFTNQVTGGDAQAGDFFLYSTAGRPVRMPQQNRGEIAEVFPNGFWSGRGPIYNRTIPLLKHYMLIGAGADNYIMVYPQRDYILNGYSLWERNSNTLNVKPHCFYLQVWIQEGFIALVAIMVFFAWYLLQSMKLYYQVKKDDELGVLGYATFLGILAYLIAVLANDSTICTAPVFWAVSGLGWGINTLRRNKEII